MSQVVFAQLQFCGPTVRVMMNGSAMDLDDMGIAKTNGGKPIVGLYITTETGGVRWALGGTTPIVASAIGHVLAVNTTLHLTGGAVKDFVVIDDAGEASARLQITPEYEVAAS